jgi:hypothetical protein
MRPGIAIAQILVFLASIFGNYFGELMGRVPPPFKDESWPALPEKG